MYVIHATLYIHYASLSPLRQVLFYLSLVFACKVRRDILSVLRFAINKSNFSNEKEKEFSNINLEKGLLCQLTRWGGFLQLSNFSNLSNSNV